MNETEECTKAIPLGGNRFGGRWGPPDVIGKRESKKSDILKAPVEIVSAEIKLETSQLVTAFGQAWTASSAIRSTWSFRIRRRTTRSIESLPFVRYSVLGLSYMTLATRAAKIRGDVDAS